jgi:hypothetical protein
MKNELNELYACLEDKVDAAQAAEAEEAILDAVAAHLDVDNA